MLSDPLNGESLERDDPEAQQREPRYPVDPCLIYATGAAIARWGLAGTTLNRIADEADMSRATFYRRRVSRGQLMAALADKAVETYRAALRPALTGTGSAAERLRAALEAMCATADRHLPLLSGIFVAHDEIVDPLGPEFLKAEVFTEPFERLLRDGVADGTLREVQPTITAAMLFNTVSWGYVRLRAAYSSDPETARQAVIDFVMRSLVTS
jgi:AcrR family transcriptional regulator